MAELSQVQTRILQANRPTHNRGSVMPDRRDTEAGRRRGFTDILSVGDGGKADSIRKALGLAQDTIEGAAGTYQKAQDEKLGNQGVLDGLSGKEDAKAMRSSLAYRTAFTTQRAQAEFLKNREALDDRIKEVLNNQTHADPAQRVAELLQVMDENRLSLLKDPETGKLRDFGSPGAARWLGEALLQDRAQLTPELNQMVEKRMNEESVNNQVGIWRERLKSGDPVDFEDNFKNVLPSVDKKAFKRALLEEAKNVSLEMDEQADAIEATDPEEADRLRIRALHILDSLRGSKLPGSVEAPAPVDPLAPLPDPLAAEITPPPAPVVSLDAMWNAIIKNEGGTDSRGNFLTSPKGAIGPAQVMPGTAPEAARLAGLPWDPVKYRTDAAYNTAIGRAYFEKQLKDFRDPAKAAAAYNGGPGRVRSLVRKHGEDWRDHLPAETKKYVTKFLKQTGGGGPLLSLPQEPGVDIASLDTPSIEQRAAATANTSGIFNGPSGAYSLSPEERQSLGETRRRLASKATAASERIVKKRQDDNYMTALLGTAGMGAYPTRTEAAAAVREGRLRPEHYVSIVRTIEADENAAAAAAKADEPNKTEVKLAEVDGLANSVLANYFTGRMKPDAARAEAARILANTGIDREVRQAAAREILAGVDTDVELKLKSPDYRSAIANFDSWEDTYLKDLATAKIAPADRPHAERLVKEQVNEFRVRLMTGQLKPEQVPDYMRRAEETLDAWVGRRFPQRRTVARGGIEVRNAGR